MWNIFWGFFGGTIDKIPKIKEGRNGWARVNDTYEPMGLLCEVGVERINVGLVCR